MAGVRSKHLFASGLRLTEVSILSIRCAYHLIWQYSGLRLADKRSLPCPNRNEWIATRDAIYEEVMEKAWNKEGQYFGQSYEDVDTIDSAILIMPLVFFIQPVTSSQSFVIILLSFLVE